MDFGKKRILVNDDWPYSDNALEAFTFIRYFGIIGIDHDIEDFFLFK